MTSQPWETLSRFVAISSPWLTLFGEKLKDDQGQILDYWRVEKADSVIVIPVQNQFLLFPKSSYRPGIQKITLDFPGGRITPNLTPTQGAFRVLQKELGIPQTDQITLKPINSQGWSVNSSFSNQQLYGFVAELAHDLAVESEYLDSSYPLTPEGIDSLLGELTCLQCRALLLEWLYQSDLKNVSSG